MTLAPTDKAVLEVKYAAPRFGGMQSADLIATAKQLIGKIGIVTGWVIPQEAIERAVLVDQLARKMTEAYSTCNAEEVMYAIRNYGTQVKDWGKAFNLSMLDQVMQPYFERREVVSKMEEDRAAEPEKVGYSPELTEADWQEWLQASREGVKSGYLSVALLPVSLYDWCEKTGRIALTAQQKREKLTDAVNIRRRELEERVVNDSSISNRKALTDFNEMVKGGEVTGVEADILRNLAKKCCLFMYLKTLKDDGQGVHGS